MRLGSINLLSCGVALLLLVGVIGSPGHTDSTLLQIESQQNKSVVSSRIATPPSKIRRYCQRLFGIYDRDANGVLNESEWNQMKGSPAKADADRNGTITLREFENHVFDFGKNRSIRLVDPDDEEIPENNIDQKTSGSSSQNQQSTDTNKSSNTSQKSTNTKFRAKSSRLPANLPGWFVSKDKNGDGQISLSEYSPRQTNAEVRAFDALDTNKDGVITPKEITRVGKKKKENPST